MSDQKSHLNRAKIAAEANWRAQFPAGSLTFVWRARGAARTASLSFPLVTAIGAGAVLLVLWSAAVTSYLAFKDDILAGLMNRQAAVQHAYEDRIRDLKGEVDRLTSRHMVDQSDLAQRVEQLQRRQSMLETRQSIIGSLSEGQGPVRAGAAPGLPTPAARPSPVGDTLRVAPPPAERQSRLESRTPQLASTAADHGGKADVVERVAGALERIEARQQAQLSALEVRAERRVRRMRAVFADLGVDPAPMVRLAQTQTRSPSGAGGPFIPIPAPSPEASPFERQVFRTQAALREADLFWRASRHMPLAKPHSGDLDLSSGFGPRLDPFLRTWALHSGVDFRGATGEPVLATGYGRVSHAGSMGGYGLMVEIDHGGEITTRYAHLSRIEVREGDMVRLGQRIGRVGSTGRSTGPHLHYETRIEGEAVDPMRFVRAGLRLVSGVD